MAPPIEEVYHDLLQPIKDAEKSFQIDVAQLLYSYIKNFVQGRVPANFNSAALLLQGSSSIYGRKVEYLFNLATQLYQNLIKNKKDDQVKNTKTTKDRHKENRFNDPFFSTEIKLGKNLSCMKRKILTKNTTTKKSKKDDKKCLFIPVDLLPFEGEEKGDIFYDTKGEAVGNKADYTLNKCKIQSSGWLILPTVPVDQIPTENSPPDYTFHCNMLNNIQIDDEDDDMCHDVDMPSATPDEGVVMGSQSMSEVPSSQATPEITLSQQTDEGLGSMQSTPQEMLSQPCSQPMEGVELSENPIDDIVSDLDVPSTSVRRSMRNAQKTQDEVAKENKEEQEENANVVKEEEIVVVKKAIQKKNTCALPSKLKSKDSDEKIESISLFCARTFFHVDNKFMKNGLMNLDTLAFRNNYNFLKRLKDRADAIKYANRKAKKNEAKDEEEQDIDIETFNEPDPDDMIAHDNLDDDDIVIDNDINNLPLPDNGDNPTTDEPPQENGNNAPLCSEDPLDNDLLIKDIRNLDKNSEITARVKAFEKRLNPFLDEVDKREAFDINLYGARILNSFESSETKCRKQTKTFQDFCKGMEQWQIHRYFMALLPLANIGNVSLETEEGPDGEDQIMITLLSKKMHHLRLEEFGNESGDSENH